MDDDTAINVCANGKETNGAINHVVGTNGCTNNSNNNPTEHTPLLNSDTFYKRTRSQSYFGVGFGLLLWRLITPGFPNPWNILALFIKNFLKFMRNFGLLLFQFCIPSLQVILVTNFISI